MIFIQERQTIKCPGITSLFVSFNYNKQIVDEIKLLEMSFYNADTKEWETPLSNLSELLDRLCIFDDIKFECLRDCQRDTQQYGLSEYKTKPFEHQIEGIQFGLQNDRWLLLDAPGLGKTLTLTYLAKELKEQRGLEHCLIICGLNTLKMNWKDEIEKHSDLSCRILGQRINRNGKLVVEGIQERLKQLQQPIEEFFVVTNIETLRDDKIVQALLKNKYNKFDMIVTDEIHVCKSNQSQQGKNLLKLNKATYRIGATGTLLLNNPVDAYVPLKWIGAERANMTNFKGYYCKFGGFSNNEIIGFKNLTILKDHIDKYSLRRTKDILNLPEKTIINEYVEMCPKQADFYTNIMEGIISQVDRVKIKNAANVLGMVTRFRQATACPQILTSENIPSAKLDRAQDLVEQLVESGEKVVVFSTFKESAYVLAQRLSKYKFVVATGDYSDDDVNRAKQMFQEDEDCKVFIGTWQKCGTGITLNAASYMIFLDVPWTDGVYEQAQDRIHRIGSKRPVFIYHLISRGTIDERVLEIVSDKGHLANYVIDDEITQEGLESLRKYIEDLL